MKTMDDTSSAGVLATRDTAASQRSQDEMFLRENDIVITSRSYVMTRTGPARAANRSPVRLERDGDNLFNGLDLSADIRPDLLPKIRSRLRTDLSVLDDRLGREASSFGGDLEILINGHEILGQLAPTLRAEVEAQVRGRMALAIPQLAHHFVRPRLTRWQKLLRYIGRMTWPLTRRSSRSPG